LQLIKQRFMSIRFRVRWLIGIALLITLPVHAAPPAGAQRIIDGSYIVVFRPDVDTDAAGDELMRRFVGMSEQFRYRHALRGMAVRLPARLVDALRKDPRVAYIEQDVVMTIAAQTLPTGINRVNADADPTANIDNVDERVDVDIAILDTGIDLDHPDLNLYRYAYCQPQGPFNYTCKENDAGADDVNTHGTHVAGIAAALDNTSGVVGVAPGARLWAVKVLENDGIGAASQLIAGVDYVTANASEIEVVNMSLTGDGSVQSLDDVISNSIAAGVVYALAAGNAQKDVSLVFPAGHPQAITVSALEDYDGKPGGASGSAGDDTFAWFSNYGSGVDIMAPGVAIRSTVPGGGLGNKSGTSMAAPHVAGAAALYMAQNPGATPATVKAALLAAGDLTPCANSSDGSCADDPDGVQEPLLLLVCDDNDGDGVCDDVDNCPLVANNNQLDTDSDLAGDACDSDDDNDGLTDSFEASIGSNSLLVDTDGDGLSDYTEVAYDGDATTYTPGADTNPALADTDGDTLSDGEEVNDVGSSPLLADTDGDGFDDGTEVASGNDPNDQTDYPVIADGDVTADGIVDVRDILLAQQILMGQRTATPIELSHGDVAPLINGIPAPDGQFNPGDLLLIQRKALGNISY
jgi:subtilisin family serine protease